MEGQREKWRAETAEPLRATLREVNALIQLLDAYIAIDNHAERFEAAEIAQTDLKTRLVKAGAESNARRLGICTDCITTGKCVAENR